MTTIPDGMPSLAKGSHDPDEGKACVMEYCSVLAGGEWTDTPYTTLPEIAFVAQALNDSLADEDRHLLVPFIGRLLNAGDNGDWTLVDKLYRRLDMDAPCMDAYALWQEMKIRVGGLFYGKLDKYDNPYYIFSYHPDAGIAYLDRVLTAYEEITGKKPARVTNEELFKARALIEAPLVRA